MQLRQSWLRQASSYSQVALAGSGGRNLLVRVKVPPERWTSSITGTVPRAMDAPRRHRSSASDDFTEHAPWKYSMERRSSPLHGSSARAEAGKAVAQTITARTRRTRRHYALGEEHVNALRARSHTLARPNGDVRARPL